MQHDGIAHIDTAMAHAGGIVGSLEKHKVARFDLRRRNRGAKTEQENLQIIQLVRSMNMKPDEFAAFLRSGALNAAPTATPYHKQEDAANET